MTREEAIKTLEQEKEESCLLESYGDGDTEWAKAYNMAIYALKHKPKIGRWSKKGECPFCGYFRQWDDDNFCGHCGAKLEVEE